MGADAKHYLTHMTSQTLGNTWFCRRTGHTLSREGEARSKSTGWKAKRVANVSRVSRHVQVRKHIAHSQLQRLHVFLHIVPPRLPLCVPQQPKNSAAEDTNSAVQRGALHATVRAMHAETTRSTPAVHLQTAVRVLDRLWNVILFGLRPVTHLQAKWNARPAHLHLQLHDLPACNSPSANAGSALAGAAMPQADCWAMPWTPLSRWQGVREEVVEPQVQEQSMQE